MQGAELKSFPTVYDTPTLFKDKAIIAVSYSVQKLSNSGLYNRVPLILAIDSSQIETYPILSYPIPWSTVEPYNIVEHMKQISGSLGAMG